MKKFGYLVILALVLVLLPAALTSCAANAAQAAGIMIDFKKTACDEIVVNADQKYDLTEPGQLEVPAKVNQVVRIACLKSSRATYAYVRANYPPVIVVDDPYSVAGLRVEPEIYREIAAKSLLPARPVAQ